MTFLALSGYYVQLTKSYMPFQSWKHLFQMETEHSANLNNGSQNAIPRLAAPASSWNLLAIQMLRPSESEPKGGRPESYILTSLPCDSRRPPRWLNDRESACQCRRHWFDPWVRKIPWRRKWEPTPVFLLKIPWTQEHSTLQSMESQRVGHDWTTLQQQCVYVSWFTLLYRRN